MKNVLILLSLFYCTNSFSQELLPDSIFLKKIYGKTDKGGKTFTCKYKGIDIYSYQENLVYSVVFKSQLNIDNNNLTFVILRAPYGTQHGHQLGYDNFYFFKTINDNVELFDSIVNEDLSPIGGINEFEIVEIGRNKKALISTFASSGNHHLENTKNIGLLELNNLTFLCSICTEYSNSCFIEIESENDTCKAEKFEESFQIIKEDKEFYDIKVHHKNFCFTKGCQESFVCSETEKILIYENGKYVEKNN